MEITLLGTGCPNVSTERYGPANLVRHGDTALLVDCGSGATQRLIAAGLSGAAVDAVLLTHLHTDHVIDLYQLIISSWHQGRDRPQRIWGPPGTRAYIDGLMALWAPEREQRIAHERRPSTAALEVEVTEIADGDAWQIGGVSVRAAEVDHKPVRHAFGFRFDAGSRSVAISGDTRPCPALIALAQGCDVLVHEVFVHREMQPVPGVRSAETVERVASYHTLSSDVGRVAREAGARVLMLTHFVPTHVDRDALLAEVSADFPGPVIVGEDLMRLDTATLALQHANARLTLSA